MRANQHLPHNVCLLLKEKPLKSELLKEELPEGDKLEEELLEEELLRLEEEELENRKGEQDSLVEKDYVSREEHKKLLNRKGLG